VSRKHTLLFLAVLCVGVLVAVAVRYAGSPVLSAAPESGQGEVGSSVQEAAGPRPETGFASVETGERVSADGAAWPAAGDLAYQALEDRVAELQRRVEDLEAELRAYRAAPGNDAGDSPASPPTSRVSEPRGKARLIAAGIDTSTAEWVQQKLDKNQLDELYLQNQASREGWLNTPRYHKQRREIQQRFDALRAELGDETFDRLLYGVGRPNRVLVSDVMQGSPAEQIGLNPNDAILFYDGKRVFSSAELQGLTKGGDPASWVLVELMRDGKPVSLYVPGGPLGVRLGAARVAPRK
jgi:hypothetical protein